MSKMSTKTKWIVVIIGAFIIVFVIVPIVSLINFKRWEVNGSAMAPTYDSGQYVLATKSDNNPTIDSIVIIRSPNSQGVTTDSIKRIVALGGDRVVIKNDKLTVYDSEHPNGYNPTSSVIASNVQTVGNVNIIIPKGDVYVLGDNRSDSFDSREYGPLPQRNIVGRVIGKNN
jgi:signal peptidase I